MTEYSKLEIIVLIACRVAPLFLGGTVSPFSKIPAMVRTSIVLIIAVSLVGVIPVPQSSNLLSLAICAELLIGFSFSLIVYAVFIAIQFWGKVVDMQMGFGAAGIMDPGSKSMDSLLGSILALGFTTFFFIVGGHGLLLEVYVNSFHVFTLGEFSAWLTPVTLMKFWGTVFLTGMMVFAPVMVLLWCVDWMVGMLSKTMPQVNIYFVTLPLKICLGMLILIIVLPGIQVVFEQLMALMFEQMT